MERPSPTRRSSSPGSRVSPTRVTHVVVLVFSCLTHCNPALEDRVTSLSSTASELVSSRPALIQETSAALLNNYVTLDYLAKRANYKEVDAAMNPFAEQASGTVATADRKEMALDLANQMRLIEGEEVSPVVGKVLALSSKIDAASAPAEGSDAAPATLLPATVDESEFQVRRRPPSPSSPLNSNSSALGSFLSPFPTPSAGARSFPA